MKQTPANVEHRIQLKLNDIEIYKRCIEHYPPERMEKFGIPHLDRLRSELNTLYSERDTSVVT